MLNIHALPYCSDLTSEALIGKNIILRVDLNIPIGEKASYASNIRFSTMLPTLQFLLDGGASKIILIAHHGGNDDTQSLVPIAQELCATLSDSVFIPDLDTTIIQEKVAISPARIIILENLRLHEGELLNDPTFAKFLADLGDLYINEAFSASHREHASIVGIPPYLPSYLGIRFQEELIQLEPFRTNLDSTTRVIVGGAKFGTKLDLLSHYRKNDIPVFVGGALAHTIYTARGYQLGVSKTDTTIDGAVLANDPGVHTPSWVLALRPDTTTRDCTANDLQSTECIVDMGSESAQEIRDFISGSSHVLWNGPLGWYEKGYVAGTHLCAEVLNTSAIKTVIGGGDTVEVLADYPLKSHVFLSTGGGALLDYLVKGTLPGIEILN